ncbi:fumarylacetoacetate hydrolase family protein [Silvibacterium dinghuense]|uniref:FAA hydrolase family protein n=1 Tax=Silvibacterium dinghuense TaxID=1560006 RepID=A0A4Q1SIJ9_9BACT|nr:fumarylacetoacetate hydrolase family protein [Silvibacterium dinghuense]RXS97227.1 FAA hydrolase family protein [Silvibacterium dinghuense]GGG97258.1 5-oxo-1,2,5-tricarboxylic-3-penten acid decarboxylase [Silvibacterium dinghuense]
MQYCRFLTASGPQYGLVSDRNGASGGERWIERLIEPFEEDPWVRLAPAGAFEPLPLTSARLLSPVVPRKIVCVGRNYRDHAAELGNEVPKQPLLFFKPSSALLAPGEAIQLPSQSERVDFEGELGLVIGRRARNLGSGDNPFDYLRGYTLVNDVTARDLQKTDGQWARAKGFDTFCPVGPIVSDELDLTASVGIETWLNGERRQHGHTRDLIFSIPDLLRYITAAMTLEPGDLIATGTPAGVAPLHSGDIVEVRIPGLGALQNPVTHSAS